MCHREVSTRTLPERLQPLDHDQSGRTVHRDGRRAHHRPRSSRSWTPRQGARCFRCHARPPRLPGPDRPRKPYLALQPVGNASPDPLAGALRSRHGSWSGACRTTSPCSTRRIPSGNYAMAVSDTRVAIADRRRRIRLRGPFKRGLVVYRLSDGEEEFRRPAPFNPDEVAFSGDGRLLAVRKLPASRNRATELVPRPGPPFKFSAPAAVTEVGKISDLPTFLGFTALESRRHPPRRLAHRHQRQPGERP